MPELPRVALVASFQAMEARQVAEAALDHPSPRQYGKALLTRRSHDDLVAHAVQVGPLPAALGHEGTVEDIRRYDPATQRSVQDMEVLVIDAASELPGGTGSGDDR